MLLERHPPFSVMLLKELQCAHLGLRVEVSIQLQQHETEHKLPHSHER